MTKGFSTRHRFLIERLQFLKKDQAKVLVFAPEPAVEPNKPAWKPQSGFRRNNKTETTYRLSHSHTQQV